MKHQNEEAVVNYQQKQQLQHKNSQCESALKECERQVESSRFKHEQQQESSSASLRLQKEEIESLRRRAGQMESQYKQLLLAKQKQEQEHQRNLEGFRQFKECSKDQLNSLHQVKSIQDDQAQEQKHYSQDNLVLLKSIQQNVIQRLNSENDYLKNQLSVVQEAFLSIT